MGITQTGAIYKTLTFDNVNSGSYGVYITGQAVYNAPQRAVEMITIPGRNGAYALDKGNFENIQVTYPAGIYAETEADFAQAVSDFRNFLCSKTGYCRLTDDYNSGEFRMAIYKSGLEVTPAQLIAGEFNIVFECKPQRWLTSGETKTTLVSGNAITNPTLFPSRPQIQTYGHGSIDIGGQVISVANAEVGPVIALNGGYKGSATGSISFDDTFANVGDTITVGSMVYTHGFGIDEQGMPGWLVMENRVGVNSVTGNGSGYGDRGGYIDSANLSIIADECTFTYGTSGTNIVIVDFSVLIQERYSGDQYTDSIVVTFTVSYDGAHTLSYSYSFTSTDDDFIITYLGPGKSYGEITYNDIIVNSTKSANGTPTYIDLDTGEAYNIEDGSAVSVNNIVSMPAELPTLPSGATTITFDNTFTKVDIVPRWWKV